MTSPSATPPAPPSLWLRDLLLLALAFGALNFFLLGGTPLANPDEARYAQIPREMLAAGDWAIGRLNGVPYVEKPPLVYWMIGLCHRLFGPGEWSMRLTPALSGLAGVLLVYAATRRLHSRTAGIAAAVVLGTSLLHFALSRVLLLDIVLSLGMSAALFCFILGVREPAGPRRRWFFYGLYAAAALATLTKGLIGFLIPGAVMFLWLLVFNQWRRLRPFYLPSGLLLFLAIAAPWHVLAAQRHPDWVQFYLVREHWERFTHPGHGRTEPWWFFVAVLVGGFFPWIGFLGSAVRAAVAGGWRRRNENADAWFFVTWALFIFLFFSKSHSKLIPYLLPIFPALAVLVGTWLARCWEDGAAARLRPGMRAFAFGCGLLGVALVVAVLKPGLIPPVENPAALTKLGLTLGAVLVTGGVLAPWLLRLRGVTAGLAALLATTVAFLLLTAVTAPNIHRISAKSLALVARDRVQPADRVYHYWAFFHDFVYYSGRPVGLVSWVDELAVEFLTPAERAARFIDDAELLRQWSGPGRVWVLVRKRDQAQPKAVFAQPGFRYHLIAESRGLRLVSNQP